MQSFWCRQGYEQCIIMVKAVDTDMKKAKDSVAMAHDEEMTSPDSDLQSGSLLDFHLRFAHLSYETVESTARDPESGIRLTKKYRPTCVTCAHGKQKRNKQSHMDTVLNAPIVRFGGVICVSFLSKGEVYYEG